MKDTEDKVKPGKSNSRFFKILNWMRAHHLHPGLIFVVLGIISTIWFLIRVLPKPSRATYPCMKVAAPLMSGFVVYLLSLGGITVALRKARENIRRTRYFPAGIFMLIALFGMVICLTSGDKNSFAGTQINPGPDDGPNQPIGKPMGINPGRVIWTWNPEATNENCTNKFDTQDWTWNPENTNEKVVGKMFSDAVNKLAGRSNISESWDLLFRYQNFRKDGNRKGYIKGEKIFIKINQNTSRGLLRPDDIKNGYHIPVTLKPTEENRKTSFGSTDTGPYVVLELLRELVNNAGVNQSDIAIGDPMCPLYGYDYDIWSKEFPGIVYIDRTSKVFGRTLITPTSKDLIFYSDKTQSDKLFSIIENADYFINMATFKPHSWAGVSLTAKNLYGAQARESASHLHYSLVANYADGRVSNGGYHKYRALVDLMGSRYLGRNTMLFIIEGLFGGGSNQNSVPVKYFMAPFSNDWSNSIFLSQDQVALESVCLDFLRTEWNGINIHNSSNNRWESMPNASGVDDYLHQAADSTNWPAGITYDPDNSGKPISSLGVHEHWNNAEKKQYSRNLGLARGIELISIPDSLVKTRNSIK
jgi:hypothetical protein